MAAIPEKRPPKAGRRSEKSTKEKTLESGSGFLPNVGRKRLLRSIREEKDPTARDKMVACLQRGKHMRIIGAAETTVCQVQVIPEWIETDLWNNAQHHFFIPAAMRFVKNNALLGALKFMQE